MLGRWVRYLLWRPFELGCRVYPLLPMRATVSRPVEGVTCIRINNAITRVLSRFGGGYDYAVCYWVDDAKTVEGGGRLFGPQWKWTYFKGSFKTKNGIRIEDENFMADPSVGTARKKVIAPDGKVLVYMDMSLKSITPKTFEILKTSLMKK